MVAAVNMGGAPAATGSAEAEVTREVLADRWSGAYRARNAACTVARMYRVLGVVYLATGCGFGFGAVDGPSKEYAFDSGDGAFYKTAVGSHVDHRGQGWSRGPGSVRGEAPLGGGMSIGFRRGIMWSGTANGQSIDSGRTADYYLQGYWGALSLGVGLTSDSGSVEVMPGQTATVGYSGYYIEPAYGLYANHLFYLGAVFAYIDGETTVNDGNYADARGLRPGLRLGISTFPLGPGMLRLTIDARYLVTPEIDGGGSYGGLSTAFALNFIL